MFALQVIVPLEDKHTSFLKSKINGPLTFMNKLNFVEIEFPKF
jgi:hypothetical protein